MTKTAPRGCDSARGAAAIGAGKEVTAVAPSIVFEAPGRTQIGRSIHLLTRRKSGGRARNGKIVDEPVRIARHQLRFTVMTTALPGRLVLTAIWTQDVAGHCSRGWMRR
jgi:hypothetical protein